MGGERGVKRLRKGSKNIKNSLYVWEISRIAVFRLFGGSVGIAKINTTWGLGFLYGFLYGLCTDMKTYKIRGSV